jgi:hypothetical protein
VFESLKRLFRREADPKREREEAENRLRAQQEIRQAEQRKSEEEVRDQPGIEGTQRGLPFGRP